MYKERDRRKELIEELEIGKDRDDEETRMINLRQLQLDQSVQETRFCEILDSLEGKTVCETLDSLSKVSFFFNLL